jgi:hypothetical protein
MPARANSHLTAGERHGQIDMKRGDVRGPDAGNAVA